MHTRSSTIIAAGVIVSFLGIVSVIAYGRSVERRSNAGPSVAAWTATAAIPAGTKGEQAAKSMRQTKVPQLARAEGAIADPKELVGRTSVRPIAKGEVVTGAAFGTQSVAPGAGLQIPPGFNAVSFNLPVPQSVAYFVQSGDLVNVYVTFKGGQPAAGPAGLPNETKLLLSNVQVLANRTATQPIAGRAIQAPQAGEAILTLALKPADAEKLVFAKENGSVWFGLVHPGDGPAQTGGQTPVTVLR
jgi:pilus assembly protein CpaB